MKSPQFLAITLASLVIVGSLSAGTPRDPWIDTAASIDLGTIPLLAGPQSFAIDINNLGATQVLDVFDAVFTGDAEFTVVDDLLTTPLAVGPMDSGQINLSFSSTVAGNYSADLQIFSSDDVEPFLIIPVTIEVAQDPQLSAPALVEIGPFPFGSGPQTFSVAVGNLGSTTNLVLSPAPGTTGGNAANFTVDTYDTPIAAGGSGNVNLTFDPMGRAGCFATVLQISSNDPGAPVTEVDLVARVVRQSLPGGLVAWWSLDDGLDPGKDDSGNGFHGTAAGSPTSVAGATGNTATALSFDGASHIEVPWCFDLNPDSFTVTLWACPTTTVGRQAAITNRDEAGAGPATHGFALYNNDSGVWDFWTGDTSPGWRTLVDGVVATNVWTHLAITYDAVTDTKRIYVDGMLENTAAGGGLYDPNGPEMENLQIAGGGDEGTSFRFDGKIDDVALFDTALTIADIQAIQNQGVPGFLAFANPFTMTVVSYDGTNAVLDVSGTEPGVNYKITASTGLSGGFGDTGVTFTDATATGIVVNSPTGTYSRRFFRAEEVAPAP